MRQGILILAAGRVRSKKKQKHEIDPAAPKIHHEIHSSPATATTSRRHATEHVPRVSPYLHASIDPRFVEISRREVNEASRPHSAQAVCVRRKKQNRKKHKKIRPTQNTPRNAQQPSDRDHPETARDETRPMR